MNVESDEEIYADDLSCNEEVIVMKLDFEFIGFSL